MTIHSTTLHAFDLARMICRKVALECEKPPNSVASAKTVAAVERLAGPDRRLAATVEQFDANAWLLNSGDTYDLRTGIGREPVPDDYLTKQAGCSCARIGTPHPLWTAFLEDDQRRWLVYEKLKAERDRLVVELKATYPGVEAKLGRLIADLERNEREIDFINRHELPTGAERLQSAELIARGIGSWRMNAADVVRITQELCLPAFKHDPHRPLCMAAIAIGLCAVCPG